MQRIADIDFAAVRDIASLKGEQLVRAIRHQSRPRRWPWQPKTLYDLAHERSAELVELAAELSAQLAAALVRERDHIQQLVRQQASLRRWPWQPKTARDHVDERGARIVASAAALSAELAELAARRRDSLLGQARRQSRPRRWWGQPKTVRDRLDERGAALRAAAGDTAGQIAESVGAARDRLDERGAALRAAAGDTAGQIAESVGAAGAAVRDAAAAIPHTLGATASAAADTLHGAADAARQRVSDTTGAVSDAISSRVEATTGAVSDAISSRVEATTGAINEGIAAGQRRVRRGVRLARWSFWSFVGGVVTGVLVAPRSGEETRRELGAAAQHLSDTLFPPDRA